MSLLVPIQRSAGELTLLRIAFAFVAFQPFANLQRWPSEQPVPTGLSRLVDLSWLSAQPWYAVTYVALILSLLFYSVGRALGVVLPLLFFITTAVFTLQNSQTGVAHHLHIIPLALLGQTIGWYRSRLFREHRTAGPSKGSCPAQELMIHDALQCIVALYFVAGITKLLETGGSWIWRTETGALWIVQGQDEAFYSRVAGNAEVPTSWSAHLLATHPMLARFVFGAGLLLELLAPLALLGRLSCFVVGVLLVGFHAANGVLMDLWFLNNSLVVAVMMCSVPWALCRGKAALASLTRRVRRLAASRALRGDREQESKFAAPADGERQCR